MNKTKEALERLTAEIEKCNEAVEKKAKEKPKGKGKEEKETVLTPEQQMALNMEIQTKKALETQLIRYIMKRCAESESLCECVLLDHKSYKRCIDYVFKKAKALATGQMLYVPDETVYEWAEDYYRMDDKEAVEKELAEAKAREEKAAKDKAEREAKEAKRKAAAERKKAKEAEKAAKEQANTPCEEVSEEEPTESEETEEAQEEESTAEENCESVDSEEPDFELDSDEEDSSDGVQMSLFDVI